MYRSWIHWKDVDDITKAQHIGADNNYKLILHAKMAENSVFSPSLFSFTSYRIWVLQQQNKTFKSITLYFEKLGSAVVQYFPPFYKQND